MAKMKELVDLIDGDSIIETKQHLTSFLALVEASALSYIVSDFMHCGNCNAHQFWSDKGLTLYLDEPDWFNCAGCELKLHAAFYLGN